MRTIVNLHSVVLLAVLGAWLSASNVSRAVTLNPGDLVVLDSLGSLLRYQPGSATLSKLSDIPWGGSGVSLGAGAEEGMAWVCGWGGNYLGRYDLATCVLSDFATPADGVGAADVKYAEGKVYVAYRNGTVNVFDAITGARLNTFVGPADFIGLDYDATNHRFILASYLSGRLYAMSLTGAFSVLASGLSNPYDVAVQPNGDVVLGNDYASYVQVVHLGGSPTISQLGTAPINQPVGVAVDSSGEIWMGDFGDGKLLHMHGDGSALASVGRIGSYLYSIDIVKGASPASVPESGPGLLLTALTLVGCCRAWRRPRPGHGSK